MDKNEKGQLSVEEQKDKLRSNYSNMLGQTRQ